MTKSDIDISFGTLKFAVDLDELDNAVVYALMSYMTYRTGIELTPDQAEKFDRWLQTRGKG
jgi:hypothetical protein